MVGNWKKDLAAFTMGRCFFSSFFPSVITIWRREGGAGLVYHFGFFSDRKLHYWLAKKLACDTPLVLLIPSGNSNVGHWFSGPALGTTSRGFQIDFLVILGIDLSRLVLSRVHPSMINVPMDHDEVVLRLARCP